MISRRNWLFTIGYLAFFFVLCVGVLYLLPTLRIDPQMVAEGFSHSMEGRNASAAKSYAVPELAHRIEQWAAKKYSTSAIADECHFSSGGGFTTEQGTWSYTNHCESGKSFEISRIRVKQIRSQWWVTDWESVCEPNVDGLNCEHAQ